MRREIAFSWTNGGGQINSKGGQSVSEAHRSCDGRGLQTTWGCMGFHASKMPAGLLWASSSPGLFSWLDQSRRYELDFDIRKLRPKIWIDSASCVLQVT